MSINLFIYNIMAQQPSFTKLRQQRNAVNKKQERKKRIQGSRINNVTQGQLKQFQDILTSNDVVKDEFEKLDDNNKQQEGETVLLSAELQEKLQKQLQHEQQLLKSKINQIPKNKAQQVEIVKEIEKQLNKQEDTKNQDANQDKGEQQKINDVYTILGMPTSYQNWTPLVRAIVQPLSSFSPKLAQMYSKKYAKQPGIIGRRKLFTKLILLKNQIDSMGPSIQYFIQLHARIKKQLQALKNNSSLWYKWWLRIKKIDPGSALYKQMNQEVIKNRQIQDRIQYLQNKLGKFDQSFLKHSRHQRKVKANQIKRYTQLMQQKTKLYAQQKKTIGFLVLKKDKQIKELDQKIQTLKQQNQRKIADITDQGISIILQQRRKEGELQQKLKQLQNQNEKDNQKIANQQRLIKQQQDYIIQQQKQNERLIQQANKSHQTTLSNLVSQREQQNSERSKLSAELKQLTEKYEANRVQMLKQLENFKYVNQKQFQKQINQKSQQIFNLSQQFSLRVKGMQDQFNIYIQNMANQHLKIKSSLQNQLKKLRQQQGFSKEKQAYILQQIADRENKLQYQRAQNAWIIRDKEQQIARLAQQSKKREKLLQEKIQKFHQQKQAQIKQILEAKKKLQEQKKRLQAEIQQKKQQISKLLSKFGKATSFQGSYMRWKNKQTTLNTIRYCFKTNAQKQWIATTRGINFKDAAYSKILQVIQYWLTIYENKSFPSSKLERRVDGTNVLMILDRYKDVNYFALRQGYYYAGQYLPTRRGFNISEAQLPVFFASIHKQVDGENVQD